LQVIVKSIDKDQCVMQVGSDFGEVRRVAWSSVH